MRDIQMRHDRQYMIYMSCECMRIEFRQTMKKINHESLFLILHTLLMYI